MTLSEPATATFKKVGKLYSMKFYFKGGVPMGWPSTPNECLIYFKEHGEWPFVVYGNTALEQYYNVQTEYQKRRGVWGDQFFTPPGLAQQVADLLLTYAPQYRETCALDACSGFGMLTGALQNIGTPVMGFDRDYELVKAAQMLHPEERPDGSGAAFMQSSYEDFSPDGLAGTYRLVVSNPPFSGDITEFFVQLHNWLADDGVAILILPVGYIRKERPAKLAQVLRTWDVLHTEPSRFEFETTKVKTELVLLQKVAPGL